MTSDSNDDRQPQAEGAATLRRQPWATPALRPLDASTAEISVGLNIDAEGHS